MVLTSCGGEDECITADDFGDYVYSQNITVSAFPPSLLLTAAEMSDQASDVTNPSEVDNMSISSVRAGVTESDAYLGSWTEVWAKGATKKEPKDFIVKRGVEISAIAEGYVSLAQKYEQISLKVTKDVINSGFSPIAETKAKFSSGSNVSVIIAGDVAKTDGTKINPKEITAFSVNSSIKDATLSKYSNPDKWLCNVGATESFSSVFAVDGKLICDFINGEGCDPVVDRYQKQNYTLFGHGYIPVGTARMGRSQSKIYDLFSDNSGFVVCSPNKEDYATINTGAGVEYSGWFDSDFPEDRAGALAGTYFNKDCAQAASDANMVEVGKNLGGLVKYAVVRGFDRSVAHTKKYIKDKMYPNIGPQDDKYKTTVDGTLEICPHPPFTAKFKKQFLMFKSLSNDPKAHVGFNVRRDVVSSNVESGIWKVIFPPCGEGTMGAIIHDTSDNAWKLAATWLSNPYLAYKLLKGDKDDYPETVKDITGGDACGILYSNNRDICASRHIRAIATSGGSGFCDISTSNDPAWRIQKLYNGGFLDYSNLRDTPDTDDIGKDEYDIRPPCIVNVNNLPAEVNVYMDDGRSWVVYPKLIAGGEVKISAKAYNEKDTLEDRIGGPDKKLNFLYKHEIPQKSNIYKKYYQFLDDKKDNAFKDRGSGEEADMMKKLGHYGWCYERHPCSVPARRCDAMVLGPDKSKEVYGEDSDKNYIEYSAWKMYTIDDDDDNDDDVLYDVNIKDLVCQTKNGVDYGANVGNYSNRLIDYVAKNSYLEGCGYHGAVDSSNVKWIEPGDADKKSAIYCNARTRWKPYTKHEYMRSTVINGADYCSDGALTANIKGHVYDEDDETPSISSHNLRCHPNQTRECGVAMGFKTYPGELHRCVGKYVAKCTEKRYTPEQCTPSNADADKQKVLGICVRKVTMTIGADTGSPSITKYNYLMAYTSASSSAVQSSKPSMKDLITMGSFDPSNYIDRAQGNSVHITDGVNVELVSMNNCGVCLKGKDTIEGGIVTKLHIKSAKDSGDCGDGWVTTFTTKDAAIIYKSHSATDTVSEDLTTDSTDVKYDVSYSFSPLSKEAACPDDVAKIDVFYDGSSDSPVNRATGAIRPMNAISHDFAYDMGNGAYVKSGRLASSDSYIRLDSNFDNIPISAHLAGEGNLIPGDGFKNIKEGSYVDVIFQSGENSYNGRFLYMYVQGLDDDGKPDESDHPAVVFPTKRAFENALSARHPGIIDFYVNSDGNGKMSTTVNKTGKVWAIVFDKAPQIGSMYNDGKYILYDTMDSIDPMSDEYERTKVAAGSSNVIGYNSGFYQFQLKVPVKTSANYSISLPILGDVKPSTLPGINPDEGDQWSFLGLLKTLFFGPIDPKKTTCKKYAQSYGGDFGTTTTTTNTSTFTNTTYSGGSVGDATSCNVENGTQLRYRSVSVDSYTPDAGIGSTQRYFCGYKSPEARTKVCKYKKSVQLDVKDYLCKSKAMRSLGIMGVAPQVAGTGVIAIQNISTNIFEKKWVTDSEARAEYPLNHERYWGYCHHGHFYYPWNSAPAITDMQIETTDENSDADKDFCEIMFCSDGKGQMEKKSLTDPIFKVKPISIWTLLGFQEAFKRDVDDGYFYSKDDDVQNKNYLWWREDHKGKQYIIPVWTTILPENPIKFYNGTQEVLFSSTKIKLPLIKGFGFKKSSTYGDEDSDSQLDVMLNTGQNLEGYYLKGSNGEYTKMTDQQIVIYDKEFGAGKWYKNAEIQVRYSYFTQEIALPQGMIIANVGTETTPINQDIFACFDNPGESYLGDKVASERIIEPTGGRYMIDLTLDYVMDGKLVIAGDTCPQTIGDGFEFVSAGDIIGKPASADKGVIRPEWVKPGCTTDDSTCYIDSVKANLEKQTPYYSCDLKSCTSTSSCSGIIYTINDPQFPQKYSNCTGGALDYQKCNLYKFNVDAFKISDIESIKSCIYKDTDSSVSGKACWVDTGTQETVRANVYANNDFAKGAYIEAPLPPKEMSSCTMDGEGNVTCTMTNRKFSYSGATVSLLSSSSKQVVLPRGDSVIGEYTLSARSREVLVDKPVYSKGSRVVDLSTCKLGTWGYTCKDPDEDGKETFITELVYWALKNGQISSLSRYLAYLKTDCNDPSYTGGSRSGDSTTTTTTGTSTTTSVNVKLVEICVNDGRDYSKGYIYQLFNGIVGSLLYQSTFFMFMVIYVGFLGYRFLKGELNLTPKEMLKEFFRIGVVVTFTSPTGWATYEIFVLDLILKASNGINDIAVSVISGEVNGNFAYQTFSPIDEIFSTMMNGKFLIKIIAAVFSLPYGTGVIMAMAILSSSIQVFITLLKVMMQYLSWVVMFSLYLSIFPMVIIFYLFEKYRSMTVKWVQTVLGGLVEMFFIFLGATVFSMISKYIIQGIVYKKVCWGTVFSLPLGDLVKYMTQGLIFFIPNIPVLSFWKYADSSDLGSLAALLNNVDPNTIARGGEISSVPTFTMVFTLILFSGLASKFLDITTEFSKAIGGASMTDALDGIGKKLSSTSIGKAVSGAAEGNTMALSRSAVSAAGSAAQKGSQKFLAGAKARLRFAKEDKAHITAANVANKKFSGKNLQTAYNKQIGKAKGANPNSTPAQLHAAANAAVLKKQQTLMRREFAKDAGMTGAAANNFIATGQGLSPAQAKKFNKAEGMQADRVKANMAGFAGSVNTNSIKPIQPKKGGKGRNSSNPNPSSPQSGQRGGTGQSPQPAGDDSSDTSSNSSSMPDEKEEFIPVKGNVENLQGELTNRGDSSSDPKASGNTTSDEQVKKDEQFFAKIKEKLGKPFEKSVREAWNKELSTPEGDNGNTASDEQVQKREQFFEKIGKSMGKSFEEGAREAWNSVNLPSEGKKFEPASSTNEAGGEALNKDRAMDKPLRFVDRFYQKAEQLKKKGLKKLKSIGRSVLNKIKNGDTFFGGTD